MNFSSISRFFSATLLGAAILPVVTMAHPGPAHSHGAELPANATGLPLGAWLLLAAAVMLAAAGRVLARRQPVPQLRSAGLD